MKGPIKEVEMNPNSMGICYTTIY